jgi:hypothetical protein
MGEKRNAYRSLVGKAERKKPLRRLRRTWEDNLKKGPGERSCDSMGWIGMAQDRDQCWALVKEVMNLLFRKTLGSS